jgi:bacillithiol system protein YtxJ
MIRKLKSMLSPPSEGAGTRESGQFPWKALEGEDLLDHLNEARKYRLQIIFKHSTSCGLSGMMLRRFQQNWENSRDQADFYLLDLIRYRRLSSHLAETLEVFHQSPQVIVLGNEGVLTHASHGNIDGIRPEELLKNPA